jgi:hypothetical protein
MISLALAVAVPMLTASLGCDDCEDGCHEQEGECWDGTGSEPEHCRKRLEECLNVCSCGSSSCQFGANETRPHSKVRG